MPSTVLDQNRDETNTSDVKHIIVEMEPWRFWGRVETEEGER